MKIMCQEHYDEVVRYAESIGDECDLSDPLYEGDGVHTASTFSGTAFDIPSGLRGFENDVFIGRDDSVVPACGVPQYFYTHKR